MAQREPNNSTSRVSKNGDSSFVSLTNFTMCPDVANPAPRGVLESKQACFSPLHHAITTLGAPSSLTFLPPRGGPGIVLAGVAYDAGIISAAFYTTLVLSAVFTSQAAGAWLKFVLNKGWPLLSSNGADSPAIPGRKLWEQTLRELKKP